MHDVGDERCRGTVRRSPGRGHRSGARVGIAIDDIELAVGDAEAHVVATLLVDGRVEEIRADGPDLVSLYRPLIERAAELRLASAFWQVIGPT
jgi:hypothetical protein